MPAFLSTLARFLGLIGLYFWTLLSGFGDDLLVYGGRKMRPPTGPSVWRRRWRWRFW